MNNAIQDLINLSKVDNSRATTNKLAKALEVAGKALEIEIEAAKFNNDAKKGARLKIVFHEIQAITEGKGDE